MGPEVVENYLANATASEMELIGEMTRQSAIANPSGKSHLVISYFEGKWPPAIEFSKTRALAAYTEGDPDYKIEWRNFTEDIVATTAISMSQDPEVGIRIYLADYLDHLLPILQRGGFEVVIIGTGSCRFSLGNLWPILALEAPDTLFTFVTPENLANSGISIKRSELLRGTGLGAWRTPEIRKRPSYYPISNSGWGAKGGMQAELLLRAFLWFSLKRRSATRSVSDHATTLGLPVPFAGDGFDHWFLAVALYPRLAENGILTFADMSMKPPIFALDIEYATWANPNSELVLSDA